MGQWRRSLTQGWVELRSEVRWLWGWLGTAGILLCVACQENVNPPVQQVAAGESPPQLGDLHDIFPQIRGVTVKILLRESWGSGFIIQHQQGVYVVVTNEHVLDRQENHHRIQTPDGVVHPAQLLETANLDGYDLALLKFQAARPYAVASLGDSAALQEGEVVIAAGFPFSDTPKSELAIAAGYVALLPPKSLPEGYQIGYTNEIQKGMSGGPVFNQAGQVVAINGIHAYPLWGDPYVFEDGERPCEPMRALMERSSWGLPASLLSRLAPQYTEFPDAKPLRLPPALTHPYQGLAAIATRKQAEAAKECKPFSLP